ncbi:MAG: FemAB family XrtA/PEP-CTERM system-associated protein [Planctomycetaceae bacterium]
MTTVLSNATPTERTHDRGEVTVVDNPECAAWEGYLDGYGAKSLYHRVAWNAVFETYRLSVIRLAATRQGRITGVLPLVRQRSRVFGDRLVSLPWFDAAGILADDEPDRRSLVDAAVRRAATLGVDVVELRQAEPIEASPHVRTDKVLMRLQLEGGPEALWDRLKAKVRNQVRKGEKSGLEFSTGGAELLPEFFAVYSRNMRDLGSPSHASRLFDMVLRSFPEAARLHVARWHGRAVGAGLTIASGDTVEIPWASSLRRYNGLCINHFLYWQLLREACREGRRWFHFGRSTLDSGTYQFKRQWGAEPLPLYWYHLGSTAAQAVERPNRESFGWAEATWRRLPLWAAQRLGPHVISKVS